MTSPEGSCENQETLETSTLLSVLESGPATHLIPTDFLLLGNLNNLNARIPTLVLKHQAGNHGIEDSLLADLRKSRETDLPNEHTHTNFIKFNKCFRTTMHIDDNATLSDLERFIYDNVKKVDEKDYKLDPALGKDDRKRKLLPVDAKRSKEGDLKRQKPTFSYGAVLASEKLDDINLSNFVHLLERLKNAKDEDWFTLPLVVDQKTLFISPQRLNQLQNCLKTIDVTDLTPELVQSTKDIVTGPLQELIALDWDPFLGSKNDLEFDQMIQAWLIIVSSTLLLQRLLRCSKFIENQIKLIFTSLTLLTNLLTHFFTLKPPQNVNLISVIHAYNSLVEETIPVLQNFSIDENILGELEYHFFKVIYASNNNILISNVLESMRLAASKLILAMYKAYPSQQESIISEIVDKFNDLPALKSKTKQYRFPYGNESVQTVSILILSIIQSETHVFEFNERYFNISENGSKSKSDQALVASFELSLNASITSYQANIDKRCQTFTRLIFKKLINEFALKKALDLLLGDFFVILTYPEYPCCENLVSAILNMAVHVIMTDTVPLNVQTYILELIGKIISKLVVFKSETFNTIPIEITQGNFSEIHSKYLDVLANFQSCNDMVSFELFIMKYLDFLVSFHSDDHKLMDTIKIEIKNLYKYKFGLLKLPVSNKSRTELSMVYQTVILTQSVARKYRTLLNFTLNMLNSPKVKIRSSAVKSLSLLIDNDPNLLVSLKGLIEVKLNENYSNVSDSILNLLSKYLSFNPLEIEKYYASVIEKAFHQNLTIKRKAIKLLVDIHTFSNNPRIRGKIFETLVLKLNDQDGIIVDLSIESLLMLLFVKLGKKYQQENITNLKVKLSINADVDMLIGNLIHLFPSRNWRQYERFLSSNVKRVTKYNKTQISVIKFALGLYINRIIERIIRLNDSSKKEMEYLMGILSSFVQIDAKLIFQDQLISIRPYIISNYENKLSYHTLRIFNVSLNNKNMSDVYEESLRQMLIVNLTKFYSMELNEAVQCLWKLSRNKTKNLVILGNVTIKIVKLLQSLQKSATENNMKLRRVLFLLGSIGKFCNFEPIRKQFIDAGIGLKKESIMLYLLNSLIRLYEQPKASSEVKLDCIKNIMNICVSHPKTFKHPRIIQILNDGLTGTEMNVKVILITSITKFMENIERISNVDANELKRSDEVKFEVDVYHGDSKNDEINSVCSNIVSKYFNTILSYCLSSGEVSFIAVEFLQLAVNFGFAIPMVCFPTISALEIAKSDDIKIMAISMHQKLYHSFASLVESCYVSGLKLTIEYSRKVYPGLNIIRCSNYLKYFIKLIDSPTKITKFYATLFKFINQNINITVLTKISDKEVLNMVSLASFMVVNLKEIDFTRIEELLDIIVNLEKLLLAQTVSVIQHYQLVFYESDDSDTDEWQKYLVLTKCLLMFHRLKECLVNMYGITTTTILKYQNGEEFSHHFQKVDVDCKLSLDDLDLLNYKRDKYTIKEMFQLLERSIEN